ncbi:MAG: AbrB/MazE/SpoVT family DNA-binding domain-containing protein [Nitrososphaerales archaeon]
MAQSVTIDEKGRIVIPKEARERAGIKSRTKLSIEVRGPGIIQLRDYEIMTRAVQNVAMKKLKGWKEEDHKEDKLLFKLSKGIEEAEDADR